MIDTRSVHSKTPKNIVDWSQISCYLSRNRDRFI